MFSSGSGVYAGQVFGVVVLVVVMCVCPQSKQYRHVVGGGKQHEVIDSEYYSSHFWLFIVWFGLDTNSG